MGTRQPLISLRQSLVSTSHVARPFPGESGDVFTFITTYSRTVCRHQRQLLFRWLLHRYIPRGLPITLQKIAYFLRLLKQYFNTQSASGGNYQVGGLWPVKMAGRVTILLVCFSIAVASAIPLPVPVVRNSQSEKKPSPYAHAVERRWIDRERPLPSHLMLRPHVSIQEQETTQPSGLLSRLRSGRTFYLLLYMYPYDPDRPIFG